MLKINYKGYEISQAKNNHVMIMKCCFMHNVTKN